MTEPVQFRYGVIRHKNAPPTWYGEVPTNDRYVYMMGHKIKACQFALEPDGSLFVGLASAPTTIGGNHVWTWEQTYHVHKGEKTLRNPDGTVATKFDGREFRDQADLWRAIGRRTRPWSNLEVWPQFCGEYPDMPPRFRRDYVAGWQLAEWYRHTRTELKPVTRDLTAEPLDFAALSEAYNSEHHTRRYNFAYWDANINAFRMWGLSWSRAGYAGEYGRLYIDGTKIQAVPLSDRDSVQGIYADAEHTVITNPEAFCVGQREWMRAMYNRDGYVFVGPIIRCVKVPCIEQVYKMGAPAVARKLCFEYTIASLRNDFCVQNYSPKKRLLSQLKMTREQLLLYNDIIDDRWLYSSITPFRIRDKFGVDDLSSFDLDSFHRMLVATQKNVAKWFCRAERKAVLKMCGDDDIANVFAETTRAARDNNAEDVRRIKDCRTRAELAELHDRLTARNREEWNARWKHNDEMNDSKIKARAEHSTLDWTDGEFIIRMPQSAEEIRMEGDTLHHCVGGYVGSHADGHTTILFMRRVDAPKFPYVTIEVDDYGVHQAHGRYNAWVAAVDKRAARALYRWAKEKVIYCPEHIVTSKATGYADNGGYYKLAEILNS